MSKNRDRTQVRRGARRRPAIAVGKWGSDPYRAGMAPVHGPLLYNEALLAIGVKRTPHASKAIGVAHCVGRDESGAALWRLSIGRVALPGRWIVIDGAFRRPQFDGAGKSQ